MSKQLSPISQRRLARIIALLAEIQSEIEADQSILYITIDNVEGAKVQVYSPIGVTSYTDHPITTNVTTTERGLRVENYAMVDGVRVIDVHLEPAPIVEGVQS